jgi:hypothetical protein
MGDNRGFSNNPKSSSRIAHHFTFDPSKGLLTNKGFVSNISFHAGMYISTKGWWGLGMETPEATGYEVSGSNSSYAIKTGYEGSNPLVPAPDIDVHSTFTLKEDLNKGVLSITAKITGDDFPSSESFIVDNAGKSLFIGVSGLSGSALTSLWGNNDRDMIEANFNIKIDKEGKFVEVQVNDKIYKPEEWNKQFENKSTEE